MHVMAGLKDLHKLVFFGRSLLGGIVVLSPSLPFYN